MSTPSTFRLNNGIDIPVLGIGCWMGYQGKEGEAEVIEMIQRALQVGYRHIDTAFNYGNEVQVGKALKESGVPRDQLFITTKLTNEHHSRVKEGFELSLRNLGCGYIDLYLMHWPQALAEDGRALPADEFPTFIDTWKEMEKLLETGKVRSIGISNFSVKTLERLLPHVTVVPAVNQVEMHPLLPQLELLDYCKSKSILLTAYTPLGKHKPQLVSHPTVTGIAETHKCTEAQALLSWLLNKGVVVIPKTKTQKRMVENMTFVDLSSQEMEALNDIHKAPGMHRSVCGFHAKGGTAYGWTYEQLGWPMQEGGIVA